MRRGLLAVAAVVAIAAAGAVVYGLTAGDRGEREPSAAASEARDDPQRRPAPKPKPPTRRFTVSVSGDLLMHSPLLDRALANGGGRYDFAPFFTSLKPYVANADLALCHLETPLGSGEPTTYPIFKTPTELAESVAKAGWDACSTASNHSLDGGQAGIDETVAALDRAGVAHTGSFSSPKQAKRPVIVGVRGTKLGLVSYTDATNGLPAPSAWSVNEYAATAPKEAAAAILADARAARRAGAEAVLVNLHWGAEYASAPTADQREIAHRLTRSRPVDAVVGQGPHVVGPIERVNGKFVVFSEGNLVSNQSGAVGLPAPTQDGLIALLGFRARGERVSVRKLEYVPTWVRPGDYRVLPADPGSDPAHAAALRDSRTRTLATAGTGDRISVAR